MLRHLSKAILFFLAIGPAAYASPVTWTLHSVTLNQGTMSGFFVYDADTQTYSDWSIVVPSEPAYSIAGETLTPINSSTTGLTGDSAFELADNTNTDLLGFFFSNPLTDAGGPDPLVVTQTPGGTFVTNFSVGNIDWATDGVAQGAPSDVPEPATTALWIGGAALLLGYSRRHRLMAKS